MKTIIIFQLLFLMLLSCNEELYENKDIQTSALKISLLQPFIDDSTIKNVNGTWKVLSYEDYVNDSVTLSGTLFSYATFIRLLTRNISFKGNLA